MSNRGNRFKKIGFKLKNFSSKVDDFVLGPDFNSKSSDKNDDFSNLNHIIVPEHNDGYVVEDFSGSRDSSPLVDSRESSSLLDDGSNKGSADDLNGLNIKNHSNEKLEHDFNEFSDDLNKQDEIRGSLDEELGSKYSKYLHPELDDSKESYLNELDFGEKLGYSVNNSKNGGFTYSNGHFNSRYHDSIKGKKSRDNLNYSDGPFGEGKGNGPFEDGLSNGHFTVDADGIAMDSRFSDGISDGLFNEEVPNEKSGVKDSLKNFKNELLKKDDKSKTRFGKIAFVLIFLVLASSMLYFMV